MNIKYMIAAVAGLERTSATSTGFSFLGFGYDQLKGNPFDTSGLGDQGWRSPVLDTTASGTKKTPDGKWVVPDHATVLEMNACSKKQTHKIIENYDEYAKHLQNAFNKSKDFPMLPGAFAFNGGSKFIRDDINSKKNVVGQTEMTCSVYKGTMSYFHKDALHSDFVSAVSFLLSDEYDEEAYSEFVTNFGTHVAVGMEIGGRWGWQTMLDYTEYRKMKAAGLNIDAALNASGYARAGLFFNYSSNVTTRFINSISKNLTYNTGGEYSTREPALWASTVKDKPDPLILTLQPIHLFISSLFIRGVEHLDVKKKNLKTFIDSYCSYLVKKERGQQSYCGSPTIVV